MSRGSTLNVSLTPDQLRQIKRKIDRGGYGSASEVVREGLRLLFREEPPRHQTIDKGRLAAAYKACAKHDRQIEREWSKVQDAWPDE